MSEERKKLGWVVYETLGPCWIDGKAYHMETGEPYVFSEEEIADSKAHNDAYEAFIKKYQIYTNPKVVKNSDFWNSAGTTIYVNDMSYVNDIPPVEPFYCANTVFELYIKYNPGENIGSFLPAYDEKYDTWQYLENKWYNISKLWREQNETEYQIGDQVMSVSPYTTYENGRIGIFQSKDSYGNLKVLFPDGNKGCAPKMFFRKIPLQVLTKPN